MLSAFLKLLSRFPDAFSPRGLVLLPMAVSSIGAGVLLAYLAQKGMLGTELVILIIGPLGGAIALSFLAFNCVSHSSAMNEQRYRTAEDSLRNQERWLQQYSQLSPGNIYILVQSPNGHVYFEYMNLAIESILEISVDRILQDADVLLRCIHPEDKEAYKQAVHQSADHLTTFSHRWRIITPSGQVKWLQGTSQPERRKNGDIAWYGVVIEITDLKQTEVELKESKERYQKILDTIPDLIIRMDRKGTYLEISLSDMFPMIISAEDVGRNIFELLPEEAAHQRMKAVEEAILFKKMCLYEFPLLVDGQSLWEEVRILPLNDEEAVIIVRDISQRFQMESAMREITQNLQQAQSIAQLGSWELDPETGTMKWSDELFRIFGLDAGQPIPRYPDVLEHIHPDERPVLVAQVERAIADHVPYQLEHRLHGADDRVRWVISRGQMIYNTALGQFRLCGTVLDITEKKQVEIALQESELRFRQLAETVKEGFFVFDTDTCRYSYLNSAYLSLVGEPSEPSADEPVYARGMSHWLNNVHPDDRPRIEAIVQEERRSSTSSNFRQGNTSKIEYRLLHPDGRLLWLRSKAFPIQDDTGKIVRIVGTVEDITQQKSLEQQLVSELMERQETEARLQEREALLRSIGDNLPKGFVYQFVHEPGKGFNFTYVSAGIERVVGLKPEELVGNFDAIADLIVEEDLQLVQKANQESLKNLSLFEVEIRKWTTWGELQWSIVRSTPHRLDDGRTIWYGVEIDITALKHAEAALKESEELFRRSFDDAPIGISLNQPDGKFLKANRYYCDLLGYPEEELLQMHFQALIHPDDLGEYLTSFEKMHRGEIRSLQLEKRCISKQGDIIPINLSASLVYDARGNALYSVCNTQDIRNRHEVDRMKDEFVSIVSHELRTPITSIEGALVLLSSGIYDTRPENAKNMLDIATKNSKRLVHLVDDILNFERLESGKVDLIMEPCQVEDLMQQTVESVSLLANQASITLKMTSCNATFHAAPDAIVQALTNLLSNAIKFSNPGQIVWVDAKEIEGNGVRELRRNGASSSGRDSVLEYQALYPPSILFSVTDQGRGIPPEKQEMIFEQFKQVDISDAREKGGTGLGLAICRRIVHQHGGEIWVESELEQGSRFFFTVPVGKA